MELCEEILWVIMEAGRSGVSSLLHYLGKVSLSCLHCCQSALFLWGRTDLLCWLCDGFVWDIHFLRYISGRFGTSDAAQCWKHKYQEVCNALDMVGFQEQVSSEVI